MPEVAIRRTPHTASEAAERLASGWAGRFGAAVTPDVLALLLALWDLETAAGAQQFNNNYGNVVATRTTTQPFYFADDSGNLRKFIAYPTSQEGATDLIATVTRDSRKEWRQGLLSGDPEEFVRALNGQRGGRFKYFEAPFERYLSTFLERWRKYEPPKAEPPSRGQTPNPSPTVPRRLSPLLLGGIATFLLWRVMRRGPRS